MKSNLRKVAKGFTLLEMTLVLCVLVGLASLGFFASSGVERWKLGRNASENLKAVYIAQRTYLADNPTKQVSSLTADNIIPYLPNNATAFPTTLSLSKATLKYRINVSPPYFTEGSETTGTRYDPSGSNTDSQWDVGE